MGLGLGLGLGAQLVRGRVKARVRVRVRVRGRDGGAPAGSRTAQPRPQTTAIAQRGVLVVYSERCSRISSVVQYSEGCTVRRGGVQQEGV